MDFVISRPKMGIYLKSMGGEEQQKKNNRRNNKNLLS